jgi:hypothetical protein
VLPQPNQPCSPTSNDAEFEWLLCLAAARQAREKESARMATGDRPGPQPRFLHVLRALVKGLHKPQGNRAA